MARRRSRNALDLWMNGARVGIWDQRDDVQTLTYDTSWTRSPQGRPLSLSLPLLPDGESHRGPTVAAYFENLLPDSTLIRGRIRERVRARSSSAFDLLAEIGRDCAGAVQILPQDDEPPTVRAIDAEPLDEHGVAQLLRGVSTVAAVGLRPDAGFRISLAGAQEKTALLWHEESWCLPRGATPTTHLFKLPLGLVGHLRADFSSSVENEWLCSEIVRGFGLKVAKTQVLTFEDQKALVVERFDRAIAPAGDWWLRLPQEDMCQASGLPPDKKYENDGGPGVPALMELLANSETPELDRRDFFRAQLVFWLLAAIDGHAKNFSLFIGPRGAFTMTPLYDIMSAYPAMGRGPNQLDPKQARLAMAVVSKNKHYLLSEIQPRHWREMGKRCGIDAEALVAETVDQVPAVLAAAAKALPSGFPAFVSDRIFAGLQRAADRIVRGG
jgi:serine/threonine-protein kinase HipA